MIIFKNALELKKGDYVLNMGVIERLEVSSVDLVKVDFVHDNKRKLANVEGPTWDALLNGRETLFVEL